MRSEASFGQEAVASFDAVGRPCNAEDAEAGQATVGQAVAEALAGGGLFFRQIADAVRRRLAPERVDEARIAAALWELVWDGRATNDTFAPVRALDAGGSAGPARTAPRRRVSSRRGRHRGYDAAPAYRESVAADRYGGGGMPAGALSGRWSLVAPSPANDTVRAVALVESLLDRYGVLSRDIALLAGVPGGLGTLMPVLRSLEDVGDVLRGMFVEGMGRRSSRPARRWTCCVPMRPRTSTPTTGARRTWSCWLPTTGLPVRRRPPGRRSPGGRRKMRTRGRRMWPPIASASGAAA